MTKQINNEKPSSLMFSQPTFYIKQMNFKGWNSIDFYHFVSREFAYSSELTVAVFKVKPFTQQLVITEAGELEAYETMFR